MENKLVSVIMSTYNTPKEYLNKSILSILNQNYKNIEFVIICDGIKEEYDYIKEKYNDKRIKLVLNNENIGLASSLNKALLLAEGDYIARMDSDDICMKNRFIKQVNFMEKHKNINICGMYAQCFGDRKNMLTTYFNDQYSINFQLLYESPLVHPTVMFRGEYVKNSNIKYDDKFKCSQDFELWSRIKNNDIYVIPKLGIYYRIHNKQITIEKRNEQLKMMNLIIERELKNNNIISTKKYKFLLNKFSGLEKIQKDDIIVLSNIIDEMVDKENNKKVKVILYNKLFKRLMNDNMLKSNIKFILQNKMVRKKIFNLTNIKFILFILKNRIKSKILLLNI